MIAAILKIIEILLGMVDRHLQEQAANQEEIYDAKFRTAIADGDFDYAAHLLNNRLRSAKRRNSAQGQESNNASSDGPGQGLPG